MADPKKARPENVPGNFFVDETCIDCDACRWVAPESFREDGGQSAVHSQPKTAEEERAAYRALVACPTSSIGAREKSALLQEAANGFPVPIEDDVFYCGYHSESSYGAASYFVRRKEGNVLVDSPRFAAPLVKRLEEMGGVRYLYLTHRDDVADHALFRERFGCERILHADDVDAGTADVEIKLRGLEPYRLVADALVIPVPGHTKGHTALLYREKFLFTGDHLAYSAERKRLVAFRSACWYSWPELVRSMERLAEYPFEWVLPGHGRRFHAGRGEMKEEMRRCLESLK